MGSRASSTRHPQMKLQTMGSWFAVIICQSFCILTDTHESSARWMKVGGTLLVTRGTQMDWELAIPYSKAPMTDNKYNINVGIAHSTSTKARSQ